MAILQEVQKRERNREQAEKANWIKSVVGRPKKMANARESDLIHYRCKYGPV